MLVALGPVIKAHELFVESQGHFTGRTVPLLGNDKLGLAVEALFFLVVGVDLGPHEEADEVGILLDRAGFPKIAHARLAAAGVGIPVQLGEDDDRDVEFFGDAFDPAGNLGDLLFPSVLSRDVGCLEELKVIDHDHANAVLLLEAAGFGLEFVDGEAGGVVDPDGGLGELPGDLHELGEIGLGEEAAAQFLHLHLGAGTEESLYERLGGHLKAEDSDGNGIVFPDRDVLDDVHRERGFPHGGARRDDDHFPAVEAVRHLVEVVELGHDAAGVPVGVIHVVDGLDDLEDVDPHFLDPFFLSGLVADTEDFFLNGIKEVGRALGPVVGLGDALGAILNDTPKNKLLFEELGVVVEERGGGDVVEEVGDGFGTADGVEGALLGELGVEDDKVELALGPGLVEVEESLEDDAVGGDVKIPRRELLNRLGNNRDGIEEHAGERGTLGIGVDRHGLESVFAGGAAEGLAVPALAVGTCLERIASLFKGGASGGGTGIGHEKRERLRDRDGAAPFYTNAKRAGLLCKQPARLSQSDS